DPPLVAQVQRLKLLPYPFDHHPCNLRAMKIQFGKSSHGRGKRQGKVVGYKKASSLSIGCWELELTLGG
ncbi:hypothetical protein, partial [Rhodopirellula bahusiensis]